MFTFIPQTPCKYWGLSEFIRKRNLVIQLGQETFCPSQYCVRIGCFTLGLDK